MKATPLLITLCCILLFSGCSFLKHLFGKDKPQKEGRLPNSTELINIKITDINGKLCPKMDVDVNEGASKSVSDNFGMASFPVPKGNIKAGSIVKIKVSNKALGIEETRQLPLRSGTLDFAITTSLGYEVKKWATLKSDTIYEDLQQNLVELEGSLKQFQTYLEDYLKENPGSAMEKYLQLITDYRRNLLSIREGFKSLLDNFLKIKSESGGNDPIINVDLETISDNHFKAKSYLKGFKKRLGTLAEGISTGIDKNKEFDLWSDIFFNTGEYEIQNLTPSQRSQIAKITNEINALYIDGQSKNPNDSLVCSIHFIGHTDGQIVGSLLEREVRLKCPSNAVLYTKPGRQQDANHYLSWLRAYKVQEHVLPKIGFKSDHVKIIGCGSWHSIGTNSNAYQRKCVISCLIRTSNQMKTYPDLELVYMN